MAGAIKDLIELLLTEIAINGTDGASLAQIWEWVRSFYHGETSNASGFHLDRAFMEDLWQWLVLNPEVSAGRDKEYNGLNLPEVEVIETQPPGLRLFVSEDRTWRALTGHEKDETKVPPSEFDLLSIIASCRSQGILQTDLARRSGQDSRSVPKRTDALHAKGYIEKRQVQARSAKTSLCVFSRFAHLASFDSTPLPTKDEPRHVVDVDSFAQNLFRVLKQHQIITRNDLKEELGLKDHWRWRILSKTIRKFEAIGCVRRVRARSQFHDTMKALHPCVLLVREPTDADMKLFKSDYKTLFSSIDQETASTIDQDADDIEEPSELQALEHQGIQWTPDISVPNLMLNIISRSGTSGRTNAQVMKEGFGKFFRRPSENTLSRMTEGWQLSQPSHLKRSAIVRDTAQSGTITHYIHYAYPYFKALVDSGRTDWEAVTFRPRDARSSKLVVPPPDAPSITDENGLAPFKTPRQKAYERDIYCVVVSKGLTNYSETKSDPIAMVNEGKLVACFQREQRRSSNFQAIYEPQQVSAAIEEVPQDEDIPGSPRMPSSHGRLGKMSKAEKIEAELKRGTKSAKEVFAAFGMDESWTHVAVRLMERPSPGVYLTPKGKARPAGKRQGRPKESRIAVFKSLKLIDFLKSHLQSPEEPDRDETGTPTVAAELVPTTELAAVTPTSSPTVEPPGEYPMPKRRRVAPLNADKMPGTQATAVISESVNISADDVTETNVQSATPADIHQSNYLETNDQSLAAPTDVLVAAPPSTDGPGATPTGVATAPVLDENVKTVEATEVETQPKATFTKSRRMDKDGSVARSRRNIIMTLIEQAGGAFPSSSELWHAFATVWMKHHKHSEKPDSRTVKAVVKYLVDAGKLRQLTFSGRSPKGEMITRHIVMKPDINPSDPVVMNLQEEMLKSNYVVPNNIEIDPEIAKVVRGGTGAPTGFYAKIAPVEPEIMVKLRNKPAFIVAQEKRKEESIQKRLLKPVRLMGIQRNGKVSDFKGMTSFARPNKRTHPVSSIRQYSSYEDQIELQEPQRPMDMTFAEPKVLKHRLSQPLDRALAEVKRRRRELPAAAKSSYDQFLGEIDYVSQWEMVHQGAEESQVSILGGAHQSPSDLAYVHHTVEGPFEQVPIDGMIQFDVDGARRRRRPESLVKTRRQKHLAATDAKPFKMPVSQESDMPEIAPFVEPQRPEDTSLIINEQLPYPTLSPPTADIVKPSIGRRRQKGLKDLGPQFIERLKHAIVVVRIIAGGVHGKNVDWDLVVKAFPRKDPELVRRNGKLLLNRDRRQLAQIQDDIRDALLEEYRKPNCALPSINFNNMAAYDWNAVTTWATTQYYAPSTQEVPNLPSSRAQFERLHEYRTAHPDNQFDSIYTPNPSITVAKRESMYSTRPYVDIPNYGREKKRNDRGQRELIDTAKCWILSNIVAKEETYNSVDAKRKLSRFPNNIIDEGVKELIRDRLIMQDNRGRVIPGRNYSLTEHFLHTFGRRRAIDADMLKQAARFKQTLDTDFRRDGLSKIRYAAIDGEVLAILALAAECRVHILPSDPPSNPFGMTEGNYETRALDKAKFKFQMIVAPDSQRYEYGNPVRSVINEHPVPTIQNVIIDIDNKNQVVSPAEKKEKPPLWQDINGNVNLEMWQLIVSAIVGIVAIRPNVDARAIYDQLQRFLPIRDIERTLAWLDRVGLVNHEERGKGKIVWRVREYWWLVLC